MKYVTAKNDTGTTKVWNQYKNISSLKIDLSETSFYDNCYLLDQNETNSDFLASEQSQGSLLLEIELLCLDCDASRF